MSTTTKKIRQRTHSENGSLQQNWKSSLTSYQDQTALKFKDKDFDKALRLLFEELSDLPHALVGFETIIIPTEAIKYFVEKAIPFTKQRVARRSASAAKRAAELRASGFRRPN